MSKELIHSLATWAVVVAVTFGSAACASNTVKHSSEQLIYLEFQQVKKPEKELPEKQTRHGELFLTGENPYFKKNYATALKWFNLAASAGEPRAQFYLGVMHEQGLGVSPDLALALKWYCKSAVQGHKEAALNAGRFYENGMGTKPSQTEARRWYLLAQREGHPGAGPRLARMYERGKQPSPKPHRTQLPVLAPDVDTPRPTGMRRPNGFAVVIGLERYANYSQIPDVPFAERDALVVREYLIESLGIPSENVITMTNGKASLANLRKVFEGQLARRIERGKSDVFVFYAGHGVPDLNTQLPYLVPFDGDPNYPEVTCYPLEKAYKVLAGLKARSVMVMLDSCFSGAAGRAQEPKMLVANSRPLRVSPKQSGIPTGLTVIARTTGTQLSSSHQPLRHGLFTYFLLRGFRGEGDLNRDGQLTSRELFDYLRPEVSKAASRIDREQTPVLFGGNDKNILMSY